jgi:hypothetical protein
MTFLTRNIEAKNELGLLKLLEKAARLEASEMVVNAENSCPFQT